MCFKRDHSQKGEYYAMSSEIGRNGFHFGRTETGLIELKITTPEENTKLSVFFGRRLAVFVARFVLMLCNDYSDLRLEKERDEARYLAERWRDDAILAAHRMIDKNGLPDSYGLPWENTKSSDDDGALINGKEIKDSADKN